MPRKPQPKPPALNTRRLRDPKYRRARRWYSDFMVLGEVRPVVDAIRERYDVLVRDAEVAE